LKCQAVGAKPAASRFAHDEGRAFSTHLAYQPVVYGFQVNNSVTLCWIGKGKAKPRAANEFAPDTKNTLKRVGQCDESHFTYQPGNSLLGWARHVPERFI
jgi:hypothetical protein